MPEDPPLPSGRGQAGPRGGTARRLRLRIAVGGVLLIFVTGLLATFAARAVLVIRLEDRLTAALAQEVSEFGRFLLVGSEPGTADRVESLQGAFDVYLASNVPSTEEAFVAFVDGQVYRSSLWRFPLDRLPADIVDRFGTGDPEVFPEDEPSGRFVTELGPGYYKALPVQHGGSRGTFVVMILPTAEFDEIGELQTYGAAAVLAVLLLASGVAWILVRRLLGPDGSCSPRRPSRSRGPT